MRDRPTLYPEVTQVRLRAGTLDRLHQVARARRTSAAELLRAAVERVAEDAPPDAAAQATTASDAS
jgi:hypothetical protein